MRHWNSRTQPWSTTAREIAEALQKDFPLKDLCWSLSNQTTMQCLIQECNQILFDPWMFWNSEGRKLFRVAGQKRYLTSPGTDLNSLPIMKLKCLNQPIPKFARPSDPFLMFPGSDGFMNPADAWHVFTGCSTISSRQNQSIDVGLLPRCQSKKCLPPRDPRSGQVKSQCQRCCSAMSVKPSNRTSPSWSAVCILIIGHFGEKKSSRLSATIRFLVLLKIIFVWDSQSSFKPLENSLLRVHVQTLYTHKHTAVPVQAWAPSTQIQVQGIFHFTGRWFTFPLPTMKNTISLSH